MLSDGQKRSKDIAALAVELGCAQILVLRDHQITRDSKDSEGVPGSYNHPIGVPVNADHHALTIEVTDLETAKLGPSHGGGIQGHEQGAVIEIACCIDEPGYFLRAEDYGQPSGGFGKRNVLGQKIPA